MQSSTKNNLIIASCYAGVLALGLIAGARFGGRSTASKPAGILPLLVGQTEKVDQVLDIIKENYVDPVKVDTLKNLQINQILSHLDPHSSYLPPVKAREQNQDLEGNYYGIGVEYTFLRDTMLVTSVKNGPAEKAGMKAGDKILTIAGTDITGTKISSQKIISLIKGRAGTLVKLGVKRGDSKEQLIAVKRNKITVSSIDAAYLISPNVGYIKISKFGARTDEDFAAELGYLQKSQMHSLILDLRHNGGGYLSAATALADEFLPDNQLIVYTQGEHEPRTDYLATKSGKFEQGKLVLLIDESTASASEIVAGAIQDLGRGIIIGRRSFGKGLVQEQFNFGDGSALNLTIARYYTPLGRSIQRPYKMKQEEYYEEVFRRQQPEEVKPEAKAGDTLPDKKATFKTNSGKVLFGGGGIMPDIYIPLDTTAFNSFFYALRARGSLTEFMFNHVVKSYKPSSLNQILTEFNLSDELYKRLVSNAVKGDLKVSPKSIELAREAVNNEIKALLARFYFGEEAYFKMLNASDRVIARSLQELKQP